jgi:hypothetical protein
VRLRVLTAVAIVVLIGAGCGSNGPSETGTGTGGDEKPTDRDKAVKFSECVRQNGVSDFPDPNAKGDFEYGVSVSPAAWKKAIDACKKLQPPGPLSAKRIPSTDGEGGMTTLNAALHKCRALVAGAAREPAVRRKTWGLAAAVVPFLQPPAAARS